MEDIFRDIEKTQFNSISFRLLLHESVFYSDVVLSELFCNRKNE